jgi:chromate transporter
MTNLVTFADATKVWLRIGCLSFGGPAGQIALMHRELVDQRKWIGEQDFLSALSFCMFLPGPEAMQLATYIGWKMHGLKGGLTAGLLFVLPGAAVILTLSTLYSLFGKLPVVDAMFWGVKAAVLVIVLEALIRVCRKALKTRFDWVLAAASFVALFCFNLPFPLIIAGAALIGYARASPSGVMVATTPVNLSSTISTLASWLAIWLIPLAALMVLLGPTNIYTALAIFFSKLAVVTFGGAYAVLAYMGQDVVEHSKWLTAPEMMDGLALAETTPGPLILVGQFVAFIAASKSQGSLLAGLAGSLVYLWMTFAPCFLWILVGAPYIDRLRNAPRLAAALAGITAAVAGVILNLSLWFGLNVIFGEVNRLSGPLPVWRPEWGNIDGAALILALTMAPVLLRWHWGIPKTLGLAAAAGLVWKLFLQMS